MIINIDLSAFFEDERKMVCVLVDPNWKRIECLQKRVEYLFEIDSVRFLNDCCYLPPQESIEIIKFCKQLKAIIPNKYSEKPKKKSKNSPQNGECEEKLINTAEAKKHDDVKKKRKYFSLDSIHDGSIIASNTAKRVKSSKLEKESLVKQDTKCMEITSTSEQTPPSMEQKQHIFEAGSKKKKKTKHSKESKDIDMEDGNQSHKNVVNEQNTTSPEKRKNSITQNETDLEEEQTCNNNSKASARSTSVPSSTFLNESKMSVQNHSKKSNPFKKKLSNKTHVYFNESGEIVNTSNQSQSQSDKNSKTAVIFRCALQEVTSTEETFKPRIFNIKHNEKNKETVEIQEDIILEPIPNLNFENNNSLNAELDLPKENTDLNNSEQLREESKTRDIPLDNYIDKSFIENNSEVDPNEKNTPSKLHSKTLNNSTMSVDCFDVSMEQEAANISENKIKVTKENHDSTGDKSVYDSSSDIEEISEVIDLNETVNNCNSSFSDSPAYPHSSHDIKINKILPFCTNLTELPNINDIVVFKMSYISKRQQPEVTNFLAGKVEHINKRTKVIKMLILDGHTEMYCIDPKFLLNWRDSGEFVKQLQVKMSDLIEPRLYSIS